MKLNLDDPRLTAYALGELDARERAEIEAELARNPECRAVVEEIRRAEEILLKELAAEPSAELSPEQRAAIEEKLRPANVIVLPRSRFYSTAGIAALAACVLFFIALQFGFFESRDKLRGVAAHDPTKQTTLPAAVTPPAPEAPKPPVVVSDKKNQSELFSFEFSTTTVSPAPITELSAEAPASGGAVPGENRSAPTPSLTLAESQTERQPSGESVFSSGKFDSINGVEQTRTGFRDTPAAPSGNSKLETDDGFALNSTSPQPTPAPSPALSGTTTYLFHDASIGGGGSGGGGAPSTVAPLSERAPSRPLEAARTRSINGSTAGETVRRQPTFTGSVYTPAPAISPSSSRLAQVNQVEGDWRFRELERWGDARGNNRFGSETATYPRLEENSFLSARQHPLSTFSIDVDTASYSNVRRFLNENRLPPRDAVRVEEMINYFKYDYPQPRGNDPFLANIEVAGCPWNPDHRLVRVGLKGREIAQKNRPPSNFVFLIDVSGSMSPRERLPLIQQALRQLVKRMSESDRVAIVVYASEAGVKLRSTSCADKEKILQAIDELRAGGSTNGGEGIRQAYREAEENFIKGGVNRVILCTDGDFNVGITDQDELVRMIQQKARSGVFLTTLGVGTDNYKDALMQRLADRGNGNYYYLDSLEEAQKVLIEQMNGTLVTIAKDVKIQIEFNPAQVSAYRLIGYEKRLLRKEDFNNDAKDAGEIGAGHTVTALYEVVPAGTRTRGSVDELKYQRDSEAAAASARSEEEKPDRYVSNSSRELLTLKLRYKQPDGDTSRLLEFPVTDTSKRFSRATTDFKFAAAVAQFGMLLRDSEHKGNATYSGALELAQEAKGADEEGYRAEFINLVRKARQLER